jgi:lysophospholipid acyltransferase (LPLAT)-like uncharacterized protein
MQSSWWCPRNITLTGGESILQTRLLSHRFDEMSKEQPIDQQPADSGSDTRGRRRLTPLRRLYFFLGMPIIRALTWLVTRTYRYVAIIGEENIAPYIAGGTACATAYWHQHHVLCSTLIKSWIDRGFKACFLISASVDGEVPERIARAWGAEVVRGSANIGGAQALRDQHAMMKKGYSIISTPDGPQGPQHEFKTAVVMMARIGNVPIVPIACAAERAWYLRRWDRFMIPKPFSRVAVAIGEPYRIPPGTPVRELEPHRQNVQRAVMSLMQECENRLKSA